MKTTRFKYAYRKSASKYHKQVGDLLRQAFPYSKVYQEYPVNKVNPLYSESSHHFDWVVQSLQLVVEVHGQQHFKATSWIGDLDDAEVQFQALQKRDSAKKEAALQAGYKYLAIPYSACKDMTLESLMLFINDAEEGQKIVTTTVDTKEIQYKERQAQKRREYLASDKHQAELEKARKYRQEQYQRIKERRKWIK